MSVNIEENIKAFEQELIEEEKKEKTIKQYLKYIYDIEDI